MFNDDDPITRIAFISNQADVRFRMYNTKSMFMRIMQVHPIDHVDAASRRRGR